jgi:DNA-binding beta-propeller fold protein YncE
VNPMYLIALFTILPVESAVQWPALPAEAIATLVDIIDVREAQPESGFWSRVGRWVGGSTKEERLSAPFDVVVDGDRIWMTCANVPGLVRFNRGSSEYRVFDCEDLSVEQPIALARHKGSILMTDSERGVVYRLEGDELRVWLNEGLQRPTGIASSSSGSHVWVADTGAHQIIQFDGDGHELSRIGTRNEADAGLNFPTFLASDPAGGVIVNDTLNYRVKHYSASGELQSAFGEEGRAAGGFVRAKGIAVTADGRVLVVDGMLDRVQMFDADGSPILQIGRQGEEEGMFWSPTGIDVDGDLVYVADTYNHRIQVMRLEERGETP